MRPPVKLEPAALRQLAQLPPKELARCISALDRLIISFGDPHQHGGISVRKLGARLYECRAGLDLRIVFSNQDDLLAVHLVGNHDDVNRFMKNLGG